MAIDLVPVDCLMSSFTFIPEEPEQRAWTETGAARQAKLQRVSFMVRPLRRPCLQKSLVTQPQICPVQVTMIRTAFQTYLHLVNSVQLPDAGKADV